MKKSFKIYKKKNYIISYNSIVYTNHLVFIKNIYNIFDDYIKHDIWNYLK